MVYQVLFRGNDVISVSPGLRLRSRREVVDWLNSIVSGSSHDACKMDIETMKDNKPRKPGHCTAESVWVGTPWTCRKRRNHYPTFLRNGVKISVNDFVFVLAEENKRLVAFLDDMYEDSRGNKMVVVQWFHKIDEVGFILPHNYNDKEIFFSHCLQDLSIECIDGLATVLSPQHFEKFSSHAQLARLELFVCQSLFDNDEVKPFDITRIKGYWKQAILKQSMGTAAPRTCVNTFPSEGIVARPKKRLRQSMEADLGANTNLVDAKVDTDASKEKCFDTCVSLKLNEEQKPTHHLTTGSQIEVLSQDSGLRGCWFRAVVIKRHKNKVKVQYDDIKDAEDEAKKLQEWLPASKVALCDPLGLRLPGRTKIRPVPTPKEEKVSLLLCPGTAVDVWWHDGWWEAIVLQKENDDKILVYFPGENQNSTFACGDLRLSKEWVGNRWVSVKERPDLLTSIFSDLNRKQVIEMRNDKPEVDDGNKLVNDACKERTSIKEDVFGNKPRIGAIDDKMKEMCIGPDLSREDFFDRLKWKSSKRRTPCITNKRKNSPENKGIRVFGDFFIRDPMKVDRDNCKYMGDGPFNSSVPTLTSLVMSR